MPLHPAWVKNIARRVLWAAIEPDISRADRVAMAEFFGQTCAYCGEPLASRWHADHLLPVDQGGFNHISNRVPACARCNEQEKQNKDWINFLIQKCNGEGELLSQRRLQIEAWVANSALAEPPVTDRQRRVWQEEVDRLAAAIDSAWSRLKDKDFGNE